MRPIVVPCIVRGNPVDNGYNRLDFTVQASSIGSDVWILIRDNASAYKVLVDGILLATFGEFPPQTFIPIGRYFVFRIPGQLLKRATTNTVTMLMYSDHPEISLGQIYSVDKKTAVFYNETLNMINSDIYRYFSFLCFFIFVYFLIQYLQLPRERSNLYFALYTLFLALYFFGSGFIWTGLNFAFFYGFFKACLFPAIAFAVVFCMTFTASGNKTIKRIMVATGMLLFLYVINFSQDSIVVFDRFRQALVVGSLMMITSFVFSIHQYLRGKPELKPLIVGGVLVLVCGLIDIGAIVSGRATLFWLQGFGIFFFLLSVFLSLAQRSSRMHQALAEYARTIELAVSRRTAELHTSNQALLQASNAKSAFLAHMSHEIRTPLNGIMGFTQLIEQGSSEPSIRYYSGLILKESDHLMHLISHILDFSRIEQGKIVLEHRPFNPVETISTVMESFAYAAREKGLQFEFLISGDIPETAVGDKLRFQQILINILGNAIKFTKHGYVRIETRGQRLAEDSRLRIDILVSDSGIGIPADKIATIFNSFEQADASISRKFGGTGLGISIARDLARLMNGDLQIQSKLGNGTTVQYHVFLDGAVALANPPSTFVVPQQAIESIAFPEYFAVLIVDDYPTNIEVLKAFLSKAKIPFQAAQSGVEALEIIGKPDNRIGLILMDIHMPGMDGFETSRHIRQLEHARHIPIVALTADAYEDTRNQCRELGFAEVLTKPVRYGTLMDCLREFAPAFTGSSTSDNGIAKLETADKTPRVASKVIDYQLLMETYFDDESLINELLQSFSSSALAVMNELFSAIESMDYNAISQKAHALKGAALNIAVISMAECALMLEESSREHNSNKVIENWGMLQKEWQAFLGATSSVRHAAL